MKRLHTSLFLNNRLFYFTAFIAVLFVVGFFVSLFFTVAMGLLLTISVLTLVDIFLLYFIKNGFVASRTLPERLSNGDKNTIVLTVENKYRFIAHTTIIEELPFQFQKGYFSFTQVVKSGEQKTISYAVQPVKRGVYNFGHINLYVSSPLQLSTRKYILGDKKELKCYPSFLRLRNFDIKAISNNLTTYGSKKIRRIGHSLEFEQIKEYVTGDDIRTLNWKATAKQNRLMVNQYVEEKSQAVYSIIDKGRAMQMHFNNLSLLDYAINATLAVSHAVLQKHDKAGMLTFAKKIENIIVAQRRNLQMSLISEALYNITTDFLESDYSLLYASIKRKITSRGLLILYTNFETLDSLNRQLPYLRAMAKNHLLLVVFFKNTELNKIVNQKALSVKDVYDKIIAEKFMYEKRQIANELRKYGIQSVLTKPEDLTGNTIDKYLELKKRGLF